jgi:hypothetical protein
MPRYVWIFALILNGSCVLAQDSLSRIPFFEPAVGLGLYYQFTSYGQSGLVDAKLPTSIPRRIQPDRVTAWNLDERVSDNPLLHAASYVTVGGRFRLADSLFLSAALNAEQRGWSAGRFNDRTINVFPYFNINYRKRFGRFRFSTQAGDLNSLRLYEGLTFYNLMTQSWVFKFSYGPFYLKHLGVADLIRDIGLGIDDVYDYSFGVEEWRFVPDSEIALTLRAGYSNNRRAREGAFWNYSAAVGRPESWRAYTQFTRRRNSPGSGAFLLGFHLPRLTYGRLSLGGRVEYRRYGNGFNAGFINAVFYRQPDEPATFDNSTGPAFFPLNVYERPFSQWAVFTEYGGRELSNFGLQLNSSLRLFGRCFARLRLDWTTISTGGEDISYPFYSTGLGFRPTNDFDIFLEVSNRVLNLDKSYPTLYLARQSYFTLRIYKPLSLWAEDSGFHRR